MARLRVVQVGLGPIGCGLASRLVSLSGVEVVGAVDPAPDKAGQRLGEVLGLSSGQAVDREALDLEVKGSLDEALSEARPAGGAVAAVHSTGSFLPRVKEQFLELAEAGLHVVSTCEELAYPWLRREDAAREIDAAARRAGVTILGTGVNPGFAMDLLPVAVSGAMSRVDKVRVERVVDAAGRRGPLQLKIGAGLTPEAFRDKARSGALGHVGLGESAALIAAAWGWRVERLDEDLQPRIASEALATEYVRVEPGQVLGIHQTAAAYRGGTPVITLDLQMYLGAAPARDAIFLEGIPPLEVTVPGGFQGDLATVAVTTNALPRVVAAPAGLLTMKDLPVPGFWAGAGVS